MKRKESLVTHKVSGIYLVSSNNGKMWKEAEWDIGKYLLRLLPHDKWINLYLDSLHQLNFYSSFHPNVYSLSAIQIYSVDI